MKNLLSFINMRWYIILSLFFGIYTSELYAESVNIDGLNYELNASNKVASVVGYSSVQSNVVIPSTVTYNGISFTVTTIRDKAFAGCTSLESISIPGTVTEVGTTQSQNYENLPFYGCTALKS
ncbi:MAG: leucine-rich repeat protein, partial [Bacteroidales bacterium]|nr:leucine-rich repeat protein [Bacteroidales bacterium]